MIAFLPTMRGLHGTVYLKHVSRSRITLARGHSDAGPDIMLSLYVLGLPGIVNANWALSLAGRLARAVSRHY